MSPELWGKHAWIFIHFVALGYPVYPTLEDKQHYYHFFHNLQFILPCFKCKYNYLQHFNVYPLTNKILSSRTALVQWTIDLHNLVNKQTAKPLLSYPAAIKQLMTPKNSFIVDYYWWLIVLVIIGSVIIYKYTKTQIK